MADRQALELHKQELIQQRESIKSTRIPPNNPEALRVREQTLSRIRKQIHAIDTNLDPTRLAIRRERNAHRQAQREQQLRQSAMNQNNNNNNNNNPNHQAGQELAMIVSEGANGSTNGGTIVNTTQAQTIQAVSFPVAQTNQAASLPVARTQAQSGPHGISMEGFLARVMESAGAGGNTFQIVMPGNNITNTNTTVHGNTTTVHGDINNNNGTPFTVNPAVEEFLRQVAASLATGDGTNVEGRLRDILRQRTEDENGAGADGENYENGAGDDKHMELLRRMEAIHQDLRKQPVAVAKQLQQDDGAIQHVVRSAVKEFRERPSNLDGGGSNLGDTFEAAAFDSPKANAANMHHSPPRNPKSPNSKEQLRELLMNVKNPRDIVGALGVVPSSDLTAGLLEHLENCFAILKEVKDGECRPPSIETDLEKCVNEGEGRTMGQIIGSKIFLFENCFVSLSANDSGNVHDDGDQIRSEVLQLQRAPTTIGQSLELLYKDGDEVVIEFNSVTISDSAKALTFVFERVCNDQDLEKCTVNAPVDGLCAIRAAALRSIASTSNIILHFNRCNLNHQQAAGLAGSSCPLIFDNSPINGLEVQLLSEGCVKVGFVGNCPPFSTLKDFVTAGKFKALMIWKMDLSMVFDGQDRDAVMAAFNQLVDAALVSTSSESITCDICAGGLTWTDDETGKEKTVERLVESRLAVWANEATSSINGIQKMGETGFLWSGKTPSTLAFTDSKGNLFSLPVGTPQVLSNGTIVELLSSKLLKYTFGENGTKTAKMPANATAAKFWCGTCALATRRCALHPPIQSAEEE